MIATAESAGVGLDFRMTRRFERHEEDHERAIASLAFDGFFGIRLRSESLAEQREKQAEAGNVELAEFREAGLTIRREARACRLRLCGFVRNACGEECAFP